MALLDVFVGAPQSKYAGLAIVAALLVVAIAMLFGKDSLPLGQKFVAILMMFLVALPGLLLSLFQLTCLVTGAGMGPGKGMGSKWWCGAYAWLGTIIVFLYALVIIAVAVMSMVKGGDVMSDLAVMDAEMFAAANKAAKEHFEDSMTQEEAMKKMAEEDASGALPPPEEVVEMFTDQAVKKEMMKKGLTAEQFENMKQDIMSPEVPAIVKKMLLEKFVDAKKEAVAADVMADPKKKETVAEMFADMKADAKKKMEKFADMKAGAMKAEAVEPAEPETFTSCGAPLHF